MGETAGGGTKLAQLTINKGMRGETTWRAQRLRCAKVVAAAGDSERLREQGRGYKGECSQAKAEDEAHLIIRLAFGAGDLGEGGKGGKPAIAAIGGIWTEEEIVFRF